MTDPTTVREALIVEVVGDAAKLLRQVETLAPVLKEACQALQQASTGLHDGLAAFETRIVAITETAKSRTVQYMAVRADEAARRSLEEQSRAMADAARVAFGAELGAAMQRLQTALQPLLERRERRRERWLTHLAAAAAASAATWIWALRVAGG